MTDVESAADTLVQGYEEEINLYLVMRSLTLKQKKMLRAGGDLAEFCDLLDEKDDLLHIIAQMESELTPAKKVVMGQDPDMCPYTWKLAALLARLTRLIREIRIMDTGNAALLQELPLAG